MFISEPTELSAIVCNHQFKIVALIKRYSAEKCEVLQNLKKWVLSQWTRLNYKTDMLFESEKKTSFIMIEIGNSVLINRITILKIYQEN